MGKEGNKLNSTKVKSLGKPHGNGLKTKVLKLELSQVVAMPTIAKLGFFWLFNSCFVEVRALDINDFYHMFHIRYFFCTWPLVPTFSQHLLCAFLLAFMLEILIIYMFVYTMDSFVMRSSIFHGKDASSTCVRFLKHVIAHLYRI